MPAHHRTGLFGSVLAGFVLLGCADTSRMFTGMWESEDALASTWISGRPQLAIGHFGPELTGIVHFRDEDGVPQACLCAFIDQQDVDLADQTFIATTERCDGARWIWQLTLDDEGADPRLVGNVRQAGDDTERVAVSFVLDDEFVPDDRRECDLDR